MLWLTGDDAQRLQAALRALRRAAPLAALTPRWNALGVHRDAEFTPRPCPRSCAGCRRSRWVTVYPFVRSLEWYILPEDERRGMLGEHGRMGREYPQVQRQHRRGVRPRRLRVDPRARGRRPDRPGRPHAAPARDRGAPARARGDPVLHRPPDRPRRARGGARMIDTEHAVLAASPAASSGRPHVETPVAYDGILLAGFGGPEGQDDVIPFLRNVTRGRGIPDERLEEVAHHYRALRRREPHQRAEPRAQGGDRGRARRARHRPAGVLGQPQLGAVPRGGGSGCRGGRPHHAARDRHQRVQLVLQLPSVPRGLSRARSTRPALGGTVTIDKVRQFFDHPGFVHAVHRGRDRGGARPGRRRACPPARIRVLFSTHSIPTADAERSGPRDRDFGAGGAYAAQHEAVAGVVMANVVDEVPAAADTGWELVYQSRSGPPTQPWLEPDVSDVHRRPAGAGRRGGRHRAARLRQRPHGSAVGPRHRGDGCRAGRRHPGRAHADPGRRSGLRQRARRPRRRAPRRHAGGASART